VDKPGGGEGGHRLRHCTCLQNLMSRSNRTRRVVARSVKAVSVRLIRTGLVYERVMTKEPYSVAEISVIFVKF